MTDRIYETYTSKYVICPCGKRACIQISPMCELKMR